MDRFNRLEIDDNAAKHSALRDLAVVEGIGNTAYFPLSTVSFRDLFFKILLIVLQIWENLFIFANCP